MRALVAAIVVGLAVACEPPPAHYLESQCEPACLTEFDVRLGTVDVLVTAPEIWKFIDEVGQQLPSQCGNDGGVSEGGLTPLWRRTIVGVAPRYDASPATRSIRGRGALAVHPTGGVAVSIDGALWLLERESGVPRHILRGSDNTVGSSEVLPFDEPIVAFTPDGKYLWTDSTGPLLLNLERYDRRFGFRVEYSWLRTHPMTFLDTWSSPSQSVGRDGTLFWASQSGTTRALETSGSVRWEQPGSRGFVTIDGNDDSWWSTPATALRARDGTVTWQPDLIPGFDPETRLLNLEGSPLGDFLPVQHFAAATGSASVVLHRRDGSSAGTIPIGFADEAVTLGNTLFLSKREELSAWSTATQQQLWSRQFDARINAGPVLSERTGSAWVVTEDCRVSEVDSAGNLIRWHQMAGGPTDQIARLSDGILYVLSMAQSEVPSGEVWFPGDVTKADGGSTLAADYACYAGIPTLCGLGIRPGPVFFLYAFRVE